MLVSIHDPGAKLLAFTSVNTTCATVLLCWTTVFRCRVALLLIISMLAVSATIGIVSSLYDLLVHNWACFRQQLPPLLLTALSAACLTIHAESLLNVHGLYPDDTYLFSWLFFIVPAFVLAVPALLCNLLLLHRWKSATVADITTLSRHNQPDLSPC